MRLASTTGIFFSILLLLGTVTPRPATAAGFQLAQSSQRSRSGLSVKERLRRARQQESQSTRASSRSAGSASRTNSSKKRSTSGAPKARVKKGTPAQLYYFSNCAQCVELKRDMLAAGFDLKAYDVAHEGPDRDRYLELGGPDGRPVIQVGDRGMSTHDINYIIRQIDAKFVP